MPMSGQELEDLHTELYGEDGQKQADKTQFVAFWEKTADWSYDAEDEEDESIVHSYRWWVTPRKFW